MEIFNLFINFINKILSIKIFGNITIFYILLFTAIMYIIFNIIKSISNKE